MAETTISIEEFLSPLSVNTEKIHSLARAFAGTFEELAVDSLEQFLPTPIAESLLRPFEDYEGR
jgi:Mn-dependent DtxR family transcriptional regulator